MSGDPPLHRLRQIFAVAFVGLVLAVGPLPSAQALQFDEVAVQQYAAERYGPQGHGAVSRWVAMLADVRGASVSAQLRAVNNFWNTTVQEAGDDRVWGRSDHWATPLETLARGRGDCEDFVIGKYFSLVHLGVDPGKLRLVYVRARKGGAESVAHMVLGYYATPDAEPLVLDNLVRFILPAGQRRDLQPVFSFNAQGVYVAGARPASVSQVTRWQHLLSRMRQEGFSF